MLKFILIGLSINSIESKKEIRGRGVGDGDGASEHEVVGGDSSDGVDNNVGTIDADNSEKKEMK